MTNIINLSNHKIKIERDVAYQNLLALTSELDPSTEYELQKTLCALLGQMDRRFYDARRKLRDIPESN